jgi:hypothetical protein
MAVIFLVMSWQLRCIFRSVLKTVETTNLHTTAQTFQQLATVEPVMPIHFWHRHSLSSCSICNVSVANFWQNIMLAPYSKNNLFHLIKHSCNVLSSAIYYTHLFNGNLRIPLCVSVDVTSRLQSTCNTVAVLSSVPKSQCFKEPLLP